MLRLVPYLLLATLAAGCSTQYPNQNPIGQSFPQATGQTLEEQERDMPGYFAGNTVVLLLGYVQNSQFDIDRWLIGLEFSETNVDTYELPTIAGMFPRMFQTRIDEGMRKGIPKELWKGVITIYADGDRIQQFTGNENPNNARVMVLDEEGKIVYFYDRGFSVAALKNLRNVVMAGQ